MRTLLPTLALLAGGMLGLPAGAQNCDSDGSLPTSPGCGFMACKTPARPAPISLWGELAPVDTSPITPARDNTDFNEFGGGPQNTYGATNPFWMSLDIDSGYLYAAISHGIQIWDLRTTPANPTFVKLVSGSATLRHWSAGELKLPLRDIDVEGTLGAITGQGDIGIAIFDFSDRTSPRFLYQDDDHKGYQVYATTIGNQAYAFEATTNSGTTPPSRPGGLLAYNMTAARAYQGCLDGAEGCPGVYVGRIGTRSSVNYVDGVDNYVVLSAGPQFGFEIWDVSNPASPVLKLNALAGAGGTGVYGTAMWKSGSKYYVGLRTDTDGRIYDVSCITGSSCSLGGPVWSMPMVSGTPELYVSYSNSNGRNFLYFGSDNKCGGSLPDPQREYLVDVSSPAAAHDITPSPTLVVSGVPVNYWSWYYRHNPTGFNQVMPRMGKFNNQYFYRAALSILDIHQLTGGFAPVADFSWSPTEVYPGTPVTFTDSSSGAPSSWAWSFLPDGSPPASTAHNPTGVTFGAPGVKSISLTATNAVGSGLQTKSLTVLDPAPAIGTVTVSPANPIVCQPVTFAATGVTGQPTLTYNWQITTRPGGSPVTSSASPSFTWNTVGTLAGDFTATLTVSNTTSATKSADFTLGALSPLPNLFAPTNDPFSAGTVQFHVAAAGATEWSWDFGDGQGFRAYTNDPISGPNPVFTYTSIGPKTVQVKVRNCIEAEHTSDTLSITIVQTSPLIASFAAGDGVFCSGPFCVGSVGVAITFTDHSMGAQLWDYDWDGDGSFEDSGHAAPVTSHTYLVQGTFTPKLKVRRGASEQNVFTHASALIIGSSTPAQITVSGASSVNINTATSFSASATGCTPNPTGWTWGTSGGSGSSTTGTISITWATTGFKSVTASNSGCAGVSGSTSVSVTDSGGGGGGGGTLAALFSVAPAPAQAGQPVTFNGTASTGSPTAYAWDFGDNQSGSGSTTTHSYAAVGTYTARLTVTKPGTGAGCIFGICAAELTKSVVVGTPPPPPFEVDFTTTATCISQFGFEQCEGTTGNAIGFTATGTGATSFTWSFGDGTPNATGGTASHTWNQAGTFTVSLTGTNGQQTKTKTRVFQITGQTTGTAKSVLLPWIAQTRGVITQSSDLYIFNPGDQSIDVAIKFLKRGAPEPNPPTETRTIAAGATLFFSDVLGDLFARDNTVGFMTVEVRQGSAEPIILSFNNTLQPDGSKFGQTVPGISLVAPSATAALPEPRFLIGLNDNPERVANFGISNPSTEPTVYQLRFFDTEGHQIGQSGDLTVGRFAQKQFQPQEIRAFGVNNASDYRVEIDVRSGNRVYPYGSNIRLATEDPAFATSEVPSGRKQFFLGSLSQPGLNGSLYRTDLVLSNPSGQATAADLSFTAVGNNSVPETPVRVTLGPGESERLVNVIADKWQITNSVGVLTIQPTSADTPVLRAVGESYDNANPVRRFGQSMTPLSDADIATTGKSQSLVGLRQGDAWRSTIWILNPSSSSGLYDVIYRKLDGTILGRFTNLGLGPGKMKQIRPSEHPLGGASIEDGFTVQVLVKAGGALAAAQVINNRTNDPAYILGATR